MRGLKDSCNSSLIKYKSILISSARFECLCSCTHQIVYILSILCDGDIIKKQLGAELHSQELNGWINNYLVSSRFVVTSNRVIDFLRFEAITQSAIITLAPYPLIPDSRGKCCSENHRFPLLSTFCQESHVLSSVSKRDAGGWRSKA